MSKSRNIFYTLIFGSPFIVFILWAAYNTWCGVRDKSRSLEKYGKYSIVEIVARGGILGQNAMGVFKTSSGYDTIYLQSEGESLVGEKYRIKYSLENPKVYDVEYLNPVICRSDFSNVKGRCTEHLFNINPDAKRVDFHFLYQGRLFKNSRLVPHSFVIPDTVEIYVNLEDVRISYVKHDGLMILDSCSLTPAGL